MAIYSLQVKTVSRSAGRSVVAAAAYRAAEKVADDRLGVVWDFTRKGGVLHSEILTPANAPEWSRDRESLWNGAEAAEDKSTRWQTATVGRDIILALPHELSDEQRLAAVRDFAHGLIARYGVAIDLALHAPDRRGDDRNYHAHILMSARRLGADGFGQKTRELDGFRNGSREVELIRQHWERIGNQALRDAGIDARIDCRSYIDQGLDREATVHLGPVASSMERNGEPTDLGDRNRAAKRNNAQRERLEGERDIASAEIIDLAAERTRREQEAELHAAIRTRSPPRILDIVTENRATFDRADLNRALGKIILDPRERAAFTDQILNLPQIVGLRETAEAPVSRYTTKSVLEDERRVLDDIAAIAGRSGYGVEASIADDVLRRHPRVRGEKEAAFRYATDIGGLAIIAGEAGTGKSTTLAAIRDGYEEAGYRVLGMAWKNDVVNELRKSGFRDSATVASELYRLKTGGERWDAKTVLVVDEAAMLATKHLADLAAYARAAGAKLILAGDEQQLPSIERGGLFGAMRAAHVSAELHEVLRVTDAAQQRAFNLMHQGQFLPALSLLPKGSIVWKGTQDEAFDALVGKWAADSGQDPDKTRFVFAYTNADVKELNGALRQVRKEQGLLGDDHILPTAEGPAAFAVNDRVQFTGSHRHRDYRRAGLTNGGAGTIRSIEGNRLTVALDDRPGAPERTVCFVVGDNHAGGEFNQIRHGYAGTIYKGQGRTLDATYLYHSHHWRSASSYVGMTRHRSNVSLFVATETAHNLGQLARQMARVDDCRAASQFVPEYNLEPRPGGRGRRSASGGANFQLDADSRAMLDEANELERRQAQDRGIDRGWDHSP